MKNLKHIPDSLSEAQTSETLLHAQPYDISASGFYFRSIEEYEQKSANHKNDYGDEVEEYEIQFIDGDDLGCDLFIGPIFDCMEAISTQKIKEIMKFWSGRTGIVLK